MKKNSQVDTSLISILPLNTIWFFKDGKPTDVTSEDLQEIEAILTQCIDDYNLEQERKLKELKAKHPDGKFDRQNYIIDLLQYKRQYVATINPKGEKVVWINCFCNSWDRDWKTELIFVKDGGNCFFNLKINLTSGQYYELVVNGEA